MEKSNLFFDSAREIDEGRVERFNPTTSKVFKKATESNEMVSLGDRLKTFVANVVCVTIEAKTIFPKEFGIDFRRFNIIFPEKIGADFVKAIKIETIVFDSLLRTTAFDFDVFKKVIYQFVDIHKFIIPLIVLCFLGCDIILKKRRI